MFEYLSPFLKRNGAEAHKGPTWNPPQFEFNYDLLILENSFHKSYNTIRYNYIKYQYRVLS